MSCICTHRLCTATVFSVQQKSFLNCAVMVLNASLTTDAKFPGACLEDKGAPPASHDYPAAGAMSGFLLTKCFYLYCSRFPHVCRTQIDFMGAVLLTLSARLPALHVWHVCNGSKATAKMKSGFKVSMVMSY